MRLLSDPVEANRLFTSSLFPHPRGLWLAFCKHPLQVVGAQLMFAAFFPTSAASPPSCTPATPPSTSAAAVEPNSAALTVSDAPTPVTIAFPSLVHMAEFVLSLRSRVLDWLRLLRNTLLLLFLATRVHRCCMRVTEQHHLRQRTCAGSCFVFPICSMSLHPDMQAARESSF